MQELGHGHRDVFKDEGFTSMDVRCTEVGREMFAVDEREVELVRIKLNHHQHTWW